MTLFANALAGALATAVTGVLIARLGYTPALAGIALIAALLFRLVIAPQRRSHSTSLGIVRLEESEG